MCEVYKENESVTLLMYTNYGYKEFAKKNQHFLPKFVTGKEYATQHWIEKVKHFLFLEKWGDVKKKENESNNSSIEYILLFVPLTQIVLLMWDVITIRR